MKKCPNCNQSFSPDNDFCPDDGSPLIIHGSTQETVFLPTPAAISPPFQNRAELGGQRRSNSSQYLIFGLILLLSVVAVGFGVAYFSSSGKSDNGQKAIVGGGNDANANEDQKRLDEKQNQVEAENLRLADERKRLEEDRKTLEAQKRSVGPLPPSNFAMIIDPPTNIRLTPNGKVQCVVNSRTVISIVSSPGILDKNGVWYRTTACGTAGLVHSSQISFNY